MSKITKSWTNARIESKSNYELIARMFGTENVPSWVLNNTTRSELIAMAKSMRNASINASLNDR